MHRTYTVFYNSALVLNLGLDIMPLALRCFKPSPFCRCIRAAKAFFPFASLNITYLLEHFWLRFFLEGGWGEIQGARGDVFLDSTSLVASYVFAFC